MEVRKDYEDVTTFTIDEDVQDRLLREQNECVFIWNTKAGWPVGVTMSYVWHDGKIWLTLAKQRPRFKAVCRDPRVCVVISSAGTSLSPNVRTWGAEAGTGTGQKTVTIKGRCVVHEDTKTKQWFYAALAKAMLPDNEAQQKGFAKTLDSPDRAVLSVTPEHYITLDADKLALASGGGIGFGNME